MGLPRHEYWSWLPFPSPGDLPDPGRDQTHVLADRFFTTEPPGKPNNHVRQWIMDTVYVFWFIKKVRDALSEAEHWATTCCAVLSCSVISYSLWPHGLLPIGLLCPQGFSRQEYWNRLPCPPPGDLLNPGIEPRSPTLQADFFFTNWATREAPLIAIIYCKTHFYLLYVIYDLKFFHHVT